MNVIKIKTEFEYTQIEIDVNSDKSYIEILNEYGKDEWELVQIINTTRGIFAILKRQKAILPKE